jgi:autoinducer 2-degrading protein
MITVLARFEMQKGKEDVAEQAISQMADAVKVDEPGCLVYMVTRGQVNTQEIYVYEVYADSNAFDAHRKTPHMRELQAAFDDCLDRSSFNIEILNPISGFVRPEAASA